MTKQLYYLKRNHSHRSFERVCFSGIYDFRYFEL